MTRSLALAVVVFASSPIAAQWTPTGLLAGVPVSEDCDRSAGAPAYAAEGPQIFTCASAAAAIDAEVAHAASFFLVHEFGHIAYDGANEAEADCWAAGQLGASPDATLYVDAIARWLEARGDEFADRLGTAAERASLIRSCSGLPYPPPETGDACCTSAGTCALPGDTTALFVGTSCYCPTEVEDGGVAEGYVCVTADPGSPA